MTLDQLKEHIALRDRYAIAALQGLMVGTDLERIYQTDRPNHTLATKFCYEVADAMLRAREEAP